jgi:hypothetical protein
MEVWRMFTLEQMELVKQEYIKEIAEYQSMLNENIQLREGMYIKREVSKRLYEKCGKDKNYNEDCDQYMDIYDSHIEEFKEELESLNLKLEIINQMMDEVRI